MLQKPLNPETSPAFESALAKIIFANSNPKVLFLISLSGLAQINDLWGSKTVNSFQAELKANIHDSIPLIELLGNWEYTWGVLLPLDKNKTTDFWYKTLATVLTFTTKNYKNLLPLSLRTAWGAAIFPTLAKTGKELLQKASFALHISQDTFGYFTLFSSSLLNPKLQDLYIEQGLPNAVDNGELVLEYQPILNLQTKKITGVEALVRWNHPLLGRLLPDLFIPVAEKTGQIEKIGNWVLRKSLEDLSRWEKRNINPPIVHINLSPLQLKAPLLESLHNLSKNLASTLEFEITETSLLASKEQLSLLAALGKEGIKIGIDDFGTGYSALNYLAHLTVDTIKLDKSFVQGTNNPKKELITKWLIGLAHSLNIRIVAEGIETVAQWEWLKNNGCTEGQGHLFAKALPPNLLKPLLFQSQL